MIRIALALALLLASCPAWADPPPRLVIPAEVLAQPGQWLTVMPDTDAKAVVYVSLDGLAAFPSSELRDPRKLIVSAPASGRFRFVAVGTLNDEQAVASFTVVVGGTPPLPPVPPLPPLPPNPPPIPANGLTVMIVYETSTIPKLPTAQIAALYSTKVREYLNAKCVVGPDGKTREWRMWDQNVAGLETVAPHWILAMGRPRASLPWIVISDGKTGHEGPFPQTVDEVLALLKKYGG